MLTTQYWNTLSTREVEIVQQLVNGNSTHTGSTELFISPHTFRTHVKNISRKLGVNSTLQIVSLAVSEGMLPQRG